MMPDEAYLDLKYFVDASVYNCPFCNRRHVSFEMEYQRYFDWSEKKTCYVYFVKCKSCDNRSMHLSFDDMQDPKYGFPKFKNSVDIDQSIFYSAPTSFFVMDVRIPTVIRELIMEAEGCLKMNFLTGASACVRKAIYELLVKADLSDGRYEDRIKGLKQKFSSVDPELFDILYHIQDMTSDKIHEQSWDKWDSQNLLLIVQTLKAILQDIYVDPKIRDDRSKQIREMREALIRSSKKAPKKRNTGPPAITPDPG